MNANRATRRSIRANNLMIARSRKLRTRQIGSEMTPWIPVIIWVVFTIIWAVGYALLH